MSYSRDEWREFLTRQHEPVSLLSQVPPDAPMDEGIALGVWNGERFVSWKKWLAKATIERGAERTP